MSEIQIVVPISLFEDGQPLTADNLKKSLSELADSKERIAQLENKIETTQRMIRDFGSHIKWIVENTDGIQKAKFLRETIERMRNYG